VPAKGSQKKQCILVKIHAASINPADHSKFCGLIEGQVGFKWLSSC